MPRSGLDTAVGWETDVGSLSGQLNLPPGWRLLWTHGVDRAPTAWLPSWTLWDIFLVVISVVLALRLLGRAAAVLVAATLVLVYQEAGAPTLVWIVLLLLLAVLRIGRGRFGQFARLSYFVVFAFTVIGVLAFAIDNFRMAIYPQLENAGYTTYQMDAYTPVPAMEAPLVKQASNLARMEEVVVTAERKSSKPDKQFLANTQVQTGPGVPTWRWRTEQLIWDGPVTAAQPIDLVLSPPWLTRSIHVVSPLLLLLLIAVFGGATLPPATPLPAWIKRFIAQASVVLFVGSAFLPPDARADIPGPDMLGELEKRLTKPPTCLPACAAVEQATVKLSGDVLSVQLSVNAATTVAIPLPATTAQWWPLIVRDGDQTGGGFARRSGTTVDRGERRRTQHRTVGAGHARRSIRIAVSDAAGQRLARLERLARLRRTERSLARRRAAVRARVTCSSRTNRRESRTGTDRTVLPPEPHVRIRPRVAHSHDATRAAPEAGSIPFAVPLVRGESLLSGSVRVENGQIIGVLPPDQQEMDWDSALATADTLQLIGPPLAQWTEQWTLVPSNFWHVDYDGFAPMKLATDDAAGPRFQPLDGETLQVRLTRPVPIPGETMTVERVDMTEVPGARARRTTLGLELLSSQGGNFPVRLPDDTKILTISINGQPQPIPTSTGALPLPIVPGKQHIEITWEAPTRHRNDPYERDRTAGRAYNIALNLALPGDRWPLFVGGPRLGPAVLYWGVMLVVIGVALLISRIPALPLSLLDGVLLGFGMSLANLPSTVLVAAWLLMLLARLRYAERLQHATRRSFQLIQIVVAGMSIGRVDRARRERADGSAGHARDAHRRQRLVGVRLPLVPGSGGEPAADGVRPLGADVGVSRRDAGVVAVARIRGHALGAVGLDRLHRRRNLETRSDPPANSAPKPAHLPKTHRLIEWRPLQTE